MKKYDKQLVVFLYIFFISASIYPMSEKLVKTLMTGVSSTLAKNSFGLLTTQENLIDSAAQVAGVGAFLYAPLYLANTSEDIHIKVNNQAHEYIRNEKKKIYTSLQKLMQNSDTIAKVNTIENPDFNILLQAHWRLKRFNWPDRRKDHFLNSEGAFWTPRMLMSAGMLASLASNPQVAASAFLASYITSLVLIGHANRKNEYCSNMPSEIEREIIEGVYASDQEFVDFIQRGVQYIADQCEEIKKADAHKDDVRYIAKIYNQTTGSYDIPIDFEMCAYCNDKNRECCCKDKKNCKIIDLILQKIADKSNPCS